MSADGTAAPRHYSAQRLVPTCLRGDRIVYKVYRPETETVEDGLGAFLRRDRLDLREVPRERFLPVEFGFRVHDDEHSRRIVGSLLGRNVSDAVDLTHLTGSRTPAIEVTHPQPANERR